MWSKLSNIVRYAFISNTSKDEDQFPVQQITTDGALNDAGVLFPYGIHANMVTDTLVVAASIEGDASNVVILGAHTPNRPKLAPGENCIYHPPTGAVVHFKADGSIEVTTKSDETVTISDDVKITGKFGCNSKEPQAAFSLGVAPTDESTNTAAIIKIQQALIANGIGVQP